MADEQTATIEPTTDGGLPVDQEFDRGAAENAADQFLDATRAELEQETPPQGEKSTPPRGPDGKFLPKEGAKAVTQTAIDPVWTELAKAEGLSDEAIASLKSEAEVEQAIQVRRISETKRVFDSLGVDPQEFNAFLQQKRSGQQLQNTQQTTTQQTQPVVSQPVEELKLDLDEDDLDPKVLATIKALAAQVNKLGAVATDNQKLSQKLAELEGYVQQSAAQAQVAQRQAMFAESWDKAAARIPGFTEYFGKPSDLLRLGTTQPNHQRVRDYIGFDAHFQPIWQNYVNRVGENDTALYLAIRDAWSASPYSKIASGGSRNGTNGSAHPTNGVVRQTARRTGAREQATGTDIDSEMNRSFAAIAEQWDRKGENPFKDLGV